MITTTRYVARTAMGKPLFISAETKAMSSAGGTIASYSLTEDLLDAAKCVNKTTAKTLIADYTEAKGSTKTFKILPVEVTYRLMEEVGDE